MSTFGTLLRSYRERAGLSQSELAAQAGLSASTISRVEKGERSPLGKRRQVLALAKALGLNQSETDALLLAADLAPSTAPELSLHPRDETLYRIARELQELRTDPQISPAQIRFVEEALLPDRREQLTGTERGGALPGRPARRLHRRAASQGHNAFQRVCRRGAQPALGAKAAIDRSAPGAPPGRRRVDRASDGDTARRSA